MKIKTGVLSIVALYGLVHALVDFSSAVTVYRSAYMHHAALLSSFSLIILYDGIAFGTQGLFGYIADMAGRFRADFTYRGVACAGIVAVIAGLQVVAFNPLAGVILAGSGNALFHVGCGAMVLRYGRNRCTLPGVFVGPGALGLSLGMIMGLSPALPMLPLTGLMAAACITICIFYAPEDTILRSAHISSPKNTGIVIALLLILFAVAVRAIGGRTGFPVHPQGSGVLLAMGISACMGKMLGGVLADRIGWIKTILVSSAVSVALIIAGEGRLAPACVGMFFIQMAMPVTLTACSFYLPGRPGFAFGLASSALVAGSLPAFFPQTTTYFNQWTVTALVILSFVAIAVAFKLRKPPEKEA
jgi:FSR family fosmidomycin resistance protein-like MFS transporter